MLKLILVFIMIFSASAQGLKKVDFKSQTSETQSPKPEPEATTVSPEKMKELHDSLAKMKANQAEAQKILDEIENEDKE